MKLINKWIPYNTEQMKEQYVEEHIIIEENVANQYLLMQVENAYELELYILKHKAWVEIKVKDFDSSYRFLCESRKVAAEVLKNLREHKEDFNSFTLVYIYGKDTKSKVYSVVK